VYRFVAFDTIQLAWDRLRQLVTPFSLAGKWGNVLRFPRNWSKLAISALYQSAMTKKLLTAGLLATVVILIALAIITVLPLGSSKANQMGYVSTCPFAPLSTAMLLVTAGVLWVVRSYIRTRL
jgi:hypothetical protein